MADVSSTKLSRRRFLLAAKSKPQAAADHQLPLLPWAKSQDIMMHCTGCMACVEACPEKVIVADGSRVSVNFSENGCSFCQACAEICEEPVFAPAEMRQMSNPWHGAAKISTACLTLSGVVCQSCGDFCDQSAIRFSPNSNAIATPAILEDRCTGCGFCLASCPADAISIDFVISGSETTTLTAEAS